MRPSDSKIEQNPARSHDRMPIWALPILTVLVGSIFVLPHALAPLYLHAGERYSPFAINGVSALVYDESYIYAAQTNYTRIHWQPAYDTDVFEYRGVPSSFPYLPFYLFGGLARFIGTGPSFIVADLIFPPAAFLLVYLILRWSAVGPRTAAVGSLGTILISFGPRNFLRVIPELFSTGWTTANQPLEYSRLLHPQFSFTLFALSVALLWRLVRKPSLGRASAAGLAGASLLYVYFYYAPVWFAACLLLALLSLLGRFAYLRLMWLALFTALLVSSFYWVQYGEIRRHANNDWRTARFGVHYGHIPTRSQLLFTLLSLLIFVSFLAARWAIERRPSLSEFLSARHVIVTTAIFLGACAALNMEVVTGLNVEPMEHFPNRLFQPWLWISAFVLVFGPAAHALRLRWDWYRDNRSRLAFSAMALLIAVATFRQVAVARNTAQFHAVGPERQVVFDWLNRNAGVGDVVLLPVSELSYLLPTETHCRQWIPNGTRTTASNGEILDRFLIAAKLLQKGETWVEKALSQSSADTGRGLGLTFTYYLFQGNFDSPDRRLRDAAVKRAVARYREINLTRDLALYRLDYVYRRTGEEIEPVAGFGFKEVLSSGFGSMYAVKVQSGGESVASLQAGN
jgi:hypothetical protein